MVAKGKRRVQTVITSSFWSISGHNKKKIKNVRFKHISYKIDNDINTLDVSCH